MTEETGWTEERLKMLKALWDEGLSISQIGQRLNVTRNAVAGKAHRLSLPKRQSPISSTAAPVRAKVKKTEEIADELPLRLALRKISCHARNAYGQLETLKQLIFLFAASQ